MLYFTGLFFLKVAEHKFKLQVLWSISVLELILLLGCGLYKRFFVFITKFFICDSVIQVWDLSHFSGMGVLQILLLFKDFAICFWSKSREKHIFLALAIAEKSLKNVNSVQY